MTSHKKERQRGRKTTGGHSSGNSIVLSYAQPDAGRAIVDFSAHRSAVGTGEAGGGQMVAGLRVPFSFAVSHLIRQGRDGRRRL